MSSGSVSSLCSGWLRSSESNVELLRDSGGSRGEGRAMVSKQVLEQVKMVNVDR